MTSKIVSIRDVARKVGYSATVVSHAINGYAHQSADREHIQQVAGDGVSAERLRPQPGHPEFAADRHGGAGDHHLVLSEVILPLKIRLEAADYGLLVMTSDDTSRGESRAIEFLRQRKVDGLIVAPAKDVKNASLYDEIAAEGTPVVLFDRWVRSQDAIRWPRRTPPGRSRRSSTCSIWGTCGGNQAWLALLHDAGANGRLPPSAVGGRRGPGPGVDPVARTTSAGTICHGEPVLRSLLRLDHRRRPYPCCMTCWPLACSARRPALA